jgi:hypothetical protein
MDFTDSEFEGELARLKREIEKMKFYSSSEKRALQKSELLDSTVNLSSSPQLEFQSEIRTSETHHDPTSVTDVNFLQDETNPKHTQSPKDKLSESQQIAMMRKELERLKARNPPSSPSSATAKQLAILKEELEQLKKSIPPSPPSAPLVSESTRQLSEIRLEIEKLKATIQPSNVPNPSPISENSRQLAMVREEIDRLKRNEVPPYSFVSEKSRLRSLQEEIDCMTEQLKRMNNSSRTESHTSFQTQKAHHTSCSTGERLTFGTYPESDTDRKVRELRAEQNRLQVELQGSYVPERNPEIEREEERLRELQRLYEESKCRANLQRLEVKRLQSLTANYDDLKKQNQELTQKLKNDQKSLDLCIVLDITASMGPWLKSAQETILQVFDGALNLAQGGIVRVAFVGYRDHYLERHFEFLDFKILKIGEELIEMKDHIQKLEAKTIGSPVDGPEDVTGALNKVKGLSWGSSTKLIFHVGDDPCHGIKYHNYEKKGDNFPDGDPNGLHPEDFLHHFAANRIDYYFMRLTNRTDKMTNIFAKVYDGYNTKFRVLEKGEDPKNFLPLVLESIHSSLSVHL